MLLKRLATGLGLAAMFALTGCDFECELNGTNQGIILYGTPGNFNSDSLTAAYLCGGEAINLANDTGSSVNWKTILVGEIPGYGIQRADGVSGTAVPNGARYQCRIQGYSNNAFETIENNRNGSTDSAQFDFCTSLAKDKASIAGGPLSHEVWYGQPGNTTLINTPSLAHPWRYRCARNENGWKYDYYNQTQFSNSSDFVNFCEDFVQDRADASHLDLPYSARRETLAGFTHILQSGTMGSNDPFIGYVNCWWEPGDFRYSTRVAASNRCSTASACIMGFSSPPVSKSAYFGSQGAGVGNGTIIAQRYWNFPTGPYSSGGFFNQCSGF